MPFDCPICAILLVRKELDSISRLGASLCASVLPPPIHAWLVIGLLGTTRTTLLGRKGNSRVMALEQDPSNFAVVREPGETSTTSMRFRRSEGSG